MSGRDDLDLKAIRRTLEDERDALVEASASTSADRAPVELDPQSVGRLSRMDAIQVQAMAVATHCQRRIFSLRKNQPSTIVTSGLIK